MAKEIAVFAGENGETVSLNEPGKIIVFRRIEGQWQVLREKPFSISRGGNLRELRKNVTEAVDFLGDCKILAALSVVGVPYYELEKAGCSVWEIAGKPGDFLDYIVEKEEEAQTIPEEGKSGVANGPVEISEGCYRISLKEIQAGNTGVTSKQALLPFLRNGTFYCLEVVCNHVPPWLEAELLNGRLEARSEQVNKDEFRLVIRKKLCDQC